MFTFWFIWPILRKYWSQPTLTTIGTTNYPIWKVRAARGARKVSHECIHTLQIDFPGVTICPSNKVVEEKVNLIKAQSPWAEDIEEYGEINFDKLLYLLTGFRNIPEQKWDDFDELEGLIDRLGQGNLTTLMRKVRLCASF